jgi:hypothetical protein
MLAGMIASDNMAEVLRGIAQRRLQGVLEISQPDNQVRIYFSQGRIVDLQSGAGRGPSALADTLKAAGNLSPDFGVQPKRYADLYDEVCRSAHGREPMDHASFQAVLKQQVLEGLYQLDLSVSAPYLFRVQMVDIETDLAPSISVGQLLLDLAALPSEARRCASVFGAGAIITVAGINAEFRSGEEESLYRCIADGASLPELARRSMLSSFYLHTLLLGLYDRGLITVRAQQPVEAPHEFRGASPLLEEGAEVLPAEPLSRPVDAALSQGDAPVIGDSSGGEAPALGCEAAEAEAQSDLRLRGMGVLNARLLHQNWVVHVVVFLFLLSAMFAPLFCWDQVFAKFGKF